MLRVELAKKEMVENPGGTKHRSLIYRLMLSFPDGVTPKAIAVGTELSLSYIRVRLSQWKKEGVVSNPQRGLWELIEKVCPN